MSLISKPDSPRGKRIHTRSPSRFCVRIQRHRASVSFGWSPPLRHADSGTIQHCPQVCNWPLIIALAPFLESLESCTVERLPNPAAGEILAPARPSPYPTCARADSRTLPRIPRVSNPSSASLRRTHPSLATTGRAGNAAAVNARAIYVLLDTRAPSLGVEHVHAPLLSLAWTPMFHARSGLDQCFGIRAVTHLPVALLSVPKTLNSILIELIRVNVEPPVVAL
ncbi:hypothetical protein B0H16DRAFT_1892231 [Mycena metata]|uniref:Uncharacterized protein n=1 Tax=Mycena metata TaxID=1033252 RepID=A0AAD7MWR9_9AGAR|nr:hypothetical protein B0H16DRAFT_1892231 [Mycena metata]